MTRTARLLNIVLGLALIPLAFLFAMGSPPVFWSEVICGFVVALLSIPRSEILESYGSWKQVCEVIAQTPASKGTRGLPGLSKS